MINAFFWSVTQCGSCNNVCFRETFGFHHQDEKNQLARNTLAITNSVFQLLLTTNVVPRSVILITLMIEAMLPSENSAHTRATWRNIQEVGILYSRQFYLYTMQ
jgi:hypothetical protein